MVLPQVSKIFSALIFMILLGSESGYSDPPVPEPEPSSPAPTPSASQTVPNSLVNGSSNGAVQRGVDRFLLLLTDLNFRENIEQAVGNPWTLEPDTEERLRSAPAWLRRRLYSIMAERMPTATMTSIDGQNDDRFDVMSSPWVMQMDMPTSLNLLNSMIDTALNLFTTEQLMDIAVYSVSRMPCLPSGLLCFPHTPGGWERLKSSLDRNSLAIVLGAIATELALNSGVVKFRTRFATADQGRVQFSVYGTARGLGVNLNSRLSAGLMVTAPNLELTAGLAGQPQGNPDDIHSDERLAFEAAVRRRWGGLRRQGSWEVIAAGNSRYEIIHGDPARQGMCTANAGVDARFNGMFDDSNLALFFGASGSTDFSHLPSSRASIGFEDQRYGGFGILQVIQNVDATTGVPNAQVQLFGGMSTDDSLAEAAHRMFRYASRISALLDRIDAAVVTRLRAVNQIRDNILGIAFMTNMSALRHDLERSNAVLLELRTRLGDYYDIYERARVTYFRLRGRAVGAITDADGVLEAVDLLRARHEVMQLPGREQAPTIPPPIPPAPAPSSIPTTAPTTAPAHPPGQ